MATIINVYDAVVFSNFHKRVPVNHAKLVESFLCDLQQVLFLPLRGGQRK